MASTSSINAELVRNIRRCLEAHIAELQAEQDAIYPASSAEYHSHREMAMDDQHWEAVDLQIAKAHELIAKLGGLEQALTNPAAELNEEVKARVESVRSIVVNLLPLLPVAPENTAAAGADMVSTAFEEPPEPNEWAEEEYEREDCRYCSGCIYCREGGGFDMADEI